jgi:hypothetical protein
MRKVYVKSVAILYGQQRELHSFHLAQDEQVACQINISANPDTADEAHGRNLISSSAQLRHGAQKDNGTPQ